MLILLTSRFLPFLDPKALIVPVWVVRELALISLVPRDIPTLDAMVIITRRVCTLFLDLFALSPWTCCAGCWSK
jgi:hypothetical protein